MAPFNEQVNNMGRIRYNMFYVMVMALLLVLASGCKGCGGSNLPHEDQLIIVADIKVLEDDALELYYRDKDEPFGADKRIRKYVKGAAQSQEVEFVVELLEFPSHIRLDFGENRGQPPMVLERLIFRYNDMEHVFSKEELKKYFRANPGLKFNFETLTAEGVVVDGKYDPSLNSNDISYFVNKLILF